LTLVISALFQAADEDSATGGPDLVRGIYPTVATITTDGFTHVEEPEIAERFQGLLAELSERDEGAPGQTSETDTGGIRS
jgi:proteasome beta subunit